MDQLEPVLDWSFIFLQKLGNCKWTGLNLRQLATKVRSFQSGCGPAVVFFGLATRLLNSNWMCMLDVPDGHSTGWYILYALDSISCNPLISIVPHLPAQLSPLHPIPCQPTCLHCASYTGPFISIAPHLPAHSSPLCLIYRPTCLHCTPSSWPTRLHHTPFPWPTHLHCTSFTGPLVSIVHYHS